MRRVLPIVVVCALVLMFSVSAAFASTCAVVPCEAMRAAAARAVDHGCMPSLDVERCGQDTATPATVSAKCDMQPGHHAAEASSPPRTAPDLTSAVVADVLAPAAIVGGSAAPAPVPVDARGAPHLSTVIRI